MKESNAIGVSVAPKDRPIQKLDSECVLQAQGEVKMDRLCPLLREGCLSMDNPLGFVFCTKSAPRS